MINLSESAVSELKRLFAAQGKEGHGLRVGVKGGGCSGLEYTMSFDLEPGKGDKVNEINGVRVFCDPKSYLFLNGMTIDFSTDLLNGGFKFKNPNASRSCSCGTSFSV